MKRLAYCVVACGALLFSAACGGGSGSPATSMPDNNSTSAPPSSTTPAPSSTTPAPSSSASVDTAFEADTAAASGAANRAATARPAFGSVTQSSSVNVSGVSADAAQVTVQGDVVTLRVRRQNGSSFSLNTADHLFEADTGISPVTGRSWGGGILLDYDANSLTVMRGAIDYDSTDTSDFMAGGYWMHIRGDWANGQVSGVEIGAFVDGPEISSAASVPVSGTATYNGIASGLYTSEVGTDVAGTPDGTVEIGEYSGSMRMQADFSSGRVSGSIYNMGVDGVGVTPDGTTYSAYGALPGVRLDLGSTPINSNGTFTGTDVTLTSPGLTIVSSEGSWGGRFSTIDDPSGDPRSVAGTHGGSATSAGGSETVFVGAHFGATGNY